MPTAGRHRAAAAALLALAAAACDNRPTGPNLSGLDQEKILSVTVTPPTDTLRVADTLATGVATQLVAAVQLRDGGERRDVRFAWSTSDTAVAVVDSTGRVTARGIGVARIRASAVQVAEARIVVRYAAARVAIAPPPAVVVAGDSLVLAWRAVDDADRPLTGVRFVARSSDEARVTVDSTGLVRVAADAPSGPVVVTVTAAGHTATATLAVQRRGFAAAASVGAPSAQGFAAGGDFTCGRLVNNHPYCWGRADYGQLGRAIADTVCLDDLFDSSRPSIACAPTGGRLPLAPPLTHLAAGAAHACGLDADGAAWCWGESAEGQTGTGRTGVVAAPTRVLTPLRFASLAAGAAHTCALTTDGAAWCWGADAAGQLGDGPHLASSTPIPVAGSRRFVQITAGLDHTCALDSAGAAFCWGGNTAGQLGIGTRASTDTVVAVTGGLTFKQLAAGGLSGDSPDIAGGVTCGVTTTGLAYCWGAGLRGQLGTGSAASSEAPALIAGSGYTAVAVGGTHACALRAGEAVCWGSYDLGRQPAAPIGSGGTPTAVAEGRTFAAITSGARHSCAVTSTGDATCWGANVFGAHGDGTQALVRQTAAVVAVPR